MKQGERGVAQDLWVWRVDLRQPPTWVDDAANRMLAPDERRRAERGTAEVRRRRLVAGIALRIAIGRALGCDPRSPTLLRDRSGKPWLAAGRHRPLHFNLSRSDDCCLIALSRGGPVGVDVERMAAIPDLEEIASSRFTPGEASAIRQLGGQARLRAFYNCWTRKEAYLKARGVGLSGGLDKVVVTVDDERPSILSLAEGDPAAWTLLNVDPGPGIVGAVALTGANVAPAAALEPSVLPLGDVVR